MAAKAYKMSHLIIGHAVSRKRLVKSSGPGALPGGMLLIMFHTSSSEKQWSIAGSWPCGSPMQSRLIPSVRCTTDPKIWLKWLKIASAFKFIDDRHPVVHELGNHILAAPMTCLKMKKPRVCVPLPEERET
jgi:hypothetical protein